MIRKILLVILGLALAGAATLYGLTRPRPVLTVLTWPGAYGRAQAAALLRPFTAAKDVDVRIAQYDGGLKELEQSVAGRQYRFDVLDMELPEAVAACRRGLLEPLDLAGLPAGADGTPAARDFVPGALGPCWVGSVVYSQAIVFQPAAGAEPSRLADFFDTKRFPGPRALDRDSAKFNLELALLADGVPPGQLYAALSTPEGLDRAFRKLQSLGPVRWWSNSADAIAMVKDGRAAMATALNGEGGIFDARWPHVIWDGQLYELDVFAIPAGDPRKERAMDFIRFATGTTPLAKMADWMPYGPARHSSMAQVGHNPETGLAMKMWLPTAHFESAVAVDEEWWRLHGAAVAPRWQAFVAGGQ
jgi:putative spermidine/putrescine transport system substrate-binding protein